MIHYEIDKGNRDEWNFGKALERLLRSILKRNPSAPSVTATITIGDTIWTWAYKNDRVR